jgi:flagellar hook assembly protein FlgD
VWHRIGGTEAGSRMAIGFTIRRAGPVTVRVYDLTGRLVRDVVESIEVNAGANVVPWDGKDRDGREVTDGPYLVSIASQGQTEKRTLAVVR